MILKIMKNMNKPVNKTTPIRKNQLTNDNWKTKMYMGKE